MQAARSCLPSRRWGGRCAPPSALALSCAPTGSPAPRHPSAGPVPPPRPARVGIFGGTFNPVHLAHLALAEDVRERLGLERVLFVPSNLPPHKGTPLPSGAERLRLMRLAIRDNPSFGAVDLEVRRGGRSYTVETLRELRRRLPAGTELYFLIGMDAFAEIGTWHEAELLAGETHFALFPRVGHPLTDPRLHAPPSWGLSAPRPLRGGSCSWRSVFGTRVFLLPTEQYSISASTIRARVARGASIRYLVPTAVERAITRGGLYSRSAAHSRGTSPRHTKGA